jgi:hypothetical protein
MTRWYPSALPAAALDFARRGWPVFPLFEPAPDGSCSCPRRQRCGSRGKHPRTRHGVRDASRDPAQIRRWWGRWPRAGIGVATGAPSGLVVIDVDPRSDGDGSLEALEREHGRLPATPRSLTGGGGVHLFFARPEGVPVVRGVPIAPGVDVKADGGYVVAPPSAHASGRRYAWEIGAALDDLTPAPLPSWIATRLARRAPPYGASTHAVRDGFLGAAFAAAGWLVRPLGPEKAAVRCPWEERHTVGARGDSSTVVFAPGEGQRLGWFHCSHEHCRDRPLADVIAALPAAAKQAARERLGLPADFAARTPDEGLREVSDGA